jgi:hypothetical protein
LLGALGLAKKFKKCRKGILDSSELLEPQHKEPASRSCFERLFDDFDQSQNYQLLTVTVTVTGTQNRMHDVKLEVLASCILSQLTQ